MFKRVTFTASVMFFMIASASAKSFKAYIKSFEPSSCSYHIFNFQDSSTYSGNPSDYSHTWYFSDGTSDTGVSVYKEFKDTGHYTVQLVIETGGVYDTATTEVVISAQGVPPTFSVSGPLCERSEPRYTITSPFTDTTSSGWGYVSYSTDFGDGTNPVPGTISYHPYSTRGTYTITMKDSTTAGCKNTSSKKITIGARPFARVPSFPTAYCQGSTIPFTATQLSAADTQGLHVTYTWKFQDNTQKSGRIVTKTFPKDSDYNAELVLTNHTGSCNDSAVVPFVVSSNPRIKFDLVPVCEDSIGYLYDSTTVPFGSAADSWAWRICDSNYSNCDTTDGYKGFYKPVDFPYGFPHGGTFNVTEYVRTLDGCFDSLRKTVYVNPTPTPNFNFQNTCLDSAMQFADASTVPTGNSIQGWKWNFGDTTFSNLQDPSHQYKKFGYNYKVKLISKTQAGCIDSITKTVEVYPLPIADFEFLPKCVGAQVSFTSTSTMPKYTDTSDGISHYFWIYGDGNTDTGAEPVHTFADSGYHYVKLVAFSDYGCSDTVTKAVYIFPTPVPGFTLSSPCERDSITFINTSKTAYGTLNARSYTWNFGDTSVANFITNPNHLYRNSGNFNVHLTAVSSAGCSKDTTIKVTIIPGPHSADSIGPECTGVSIIFTNKTTSKEPGSIKYTWKFGDGSTDTAKSPVHTYPSSGNYRGWLTSIMPSTGCNDSIQLFVPVTPRPIAYFTANNACSDTAISFTDSSHVPGYPNSLKEEDFDFGDGSFGKGPATTHLYADSGTYTVKEYVTSNSNCEDSFIKIVHVYKVPTANFSYVISCAGTPTPFTDLTPSGDSVTSWNWLFSNIDTASSQDTSHVYNDYDVLTSSLTVSTVHGCTDTKYENVNIKQSPVATFTYLKNCNLRPFQFNGYNNNSSVFNPTIVWEFGDTIDSATDTSYDINPIHNFTNAGKYWVTLTETSSQGCVNIDSQSVTVMQVPVPGFSYFGNCLGEQYIFADTTVLTNPSVQFPVWSFGDGNVYSGKNGVSNTYTAPGTYLVKMYELDSGYCAPTDTAKAYVVVNPKPTVNFGWDTICFGNPTPFYDSSMSNGGTIASYLWDFGDGRTDTLFPQPYNHTFADSFKGNDTTYRVILKLSTNNGCTNVDTQTIYIRQVPFVYFTVNPDPVDIQSPQVMFTNTTLHADSNDYYWTFGDNTDSHEINPVHTYKDTGTYVVTLSADNDYCQDTFRYIVYVTPGYTIYAPDAITVNGDKLNDSWMAKGVGVIDFDVVIVDRWGQQVFHSTNINQPWNGDYNGNGVKVPEGVYVYYIKAGDFSNTNFTSLKGRITVLR